jgi:hypothetical protein
MKLSGTSATSCGRDGRLTATGQQALGKSGAARTRTGNGNISETKKRLTNSMIVNIETVKVTQP